MKTAMFELIENWHNNETIALKNAMECIEYAEALGFDEAWIGEHHFNSFTICSSPIALMSYILARTKTIKIGSATILLPHYHPIKLAEEIAMLDLLGNGRFLFGFGRGAFPIFDATMGNFDNNHKIMLEGAEIIHNLLFKDQVQFNGEFFAINCLSIRPHPKSLIPFFVASLDTTTLELSAKRGYGFLGAFTLDIQRAKAIYDLFIKNSPSKAFEFVLTRGIYIDNDRTKAQEEAQIGADIFSQCMLKTNALHPNHKEMQTEFFNKDKILENMLVGTPKDVLEQILELLKQVPITTLSLKPFASKLQDSKNILRLYKEQISPFLCN